MSVEKFSVSLDPQLGQALRAAAQADNTNISAWLATAIRQRLRHAALGAALDEILAEQGWSRNELLAESPAARPASDRRESGGRVSNEAERRGAAPVLRPAKRSA